MTIHPCLALIGFGEAATAFAADLRGKNSFRAFDIKTENPATSAAKWEDYRACGVTGFANLTEAVAEADIMLSLVTADQALAAAREAAKYLKPGALYCDFNSVSPATKSAASRLIEAAGGAYADVAIMAPVQPLRLKTPLLVSGDVAEQAAASLKKLGFLPRQVDGPVGQAASIKMIRSVMVKGLEALSAECFLAAHAAGVVEEVAASLNATWPGTDWTQKADYNLDRMMLHGLRRAAEMEEVARTLAELGVDNIMTRAAAETQSRIGSLGLPALPGLEAKAEAVGSQRLETA